MGESDWEMKVNLKVVIALLVTGAVFLAGYRFGVLKVQRVSGIAHGEPERVGPLTLGAVPGFLPEHRTSDASPLFLPPKHADIVIPLPSNSERQ